MISETVVQSERHTLRWSLAVASFLTALKVGIGLWTHSLAILASAVDSLMDIMASTVNFISLRAAEAPPDSRHPYGHGKIESLAGLIQCVFLTASSSALIWQAVKRLLVGEPLRQVGWGMATMAFSAIITLALVLRLSQALRRTGSLIFESERLHYASDVWTNAGVLLTLFLVSRTGLGLLDPLVSFAVAVYILAGAGKIVTRAFHNLIDERASEDIEPRLSQLILAYHPSVAGFHDLRTRRSGSRIFIEVHVVFKNEDSFRAVHETTEGLIRKIQQSIPASEVVVHMDPEGAA
jgi:ferrous-iron efflux pump FieF